MKRLIALAAGAVLLMASPALGQAQGISDPNDSASPLDIRSMLFTAGDNDVHTLSVSTDEKWRCGYHDKGVRMVWRFDGRGNNRMDLVGKVRCLKPAEGPRELVMFLSGKKNSYEPVGFTRPDRHSMQVEFSFDIPELSGRHVDLVVKVRDAKAAGCSWKDKCTDRAPNKGRWRLY